MTRGRHHRPRWQPTLQGVAIADGAMLAVGLTFAVATSVAPHAHAPVTVAAPTAVDLREPAGHGGPIGPLAGPSFAPDVPVWSEEKGPVIVNGQALTRPTVVAPVPEPEPIPESSPTPTPVPAPPVAPVAAAEPTPPPVVVVPEPTEPEVTEPEVTEPVETPVETTPPTETPAEPTPVVGLPEVADLAPTDVAGVEK